MSAEVAGIVELARRLAREAGEIQRQGYEQSHRIESKSSAVDLVTEIDRACEAHLVAALAEARPGDSILAEEGGGHEQPGAPWRWVIDPLDGTTNYAHSYPRFCVSIGVERGGEPHLGVIYDPLLDELYHGVRGGGAFLNDRPIRVSEERELARSLLATGFAYDRRASEVDNLEHFGAFLKAGRALRRDGSAALDLCYVACGRLDGYWELKLQPWDVCAGGVVLEEAGGRLSDFSGARLVGAEQILASNGRIHEAMQAVLAETRR